MYEYVSVWVYECMSIIFVLCSVSFSIGDRNGCALDDQHIMIQHLTNHEWKNVCMYVYMYVYTCVYVVPIVIHSVLDTCYYAIRMLWMIFARWCLLAYNIHTYIHTYMHTHTHIGDCPYNDNIRQSMQVSLSCASD